MSVLIFSFYLPVHLWRRSPNANHLSYSKIYFEKRYFCVSYRTSGHTCRFSNPKCRLSDRPNRSPVSYRLGGNLNYLHSLRALLIYTLILIVGRYAGNRRNDAWTNRRFEALNCNLKKKKRLSYMFSEYFHLNKYSRIILGFAYKLFCTHGFFVDYWEVNQGVLIYYIILMSNHYFKLS